MPAGFTLIELMIVVAIVIIMSAVAIPSFQSVISSRRLQAVAWQMVQDLRMVREDAILYQQDLNVYINYNNAPVAPTDPTNKNNRSYLFETFQQGIPGNHYIPGDTNSHFTERVLQSGIIITSITSTGFASTQINVNGKNYYYWVVCFRCGSGSAFRGEADIITGNTFSQTQRTDPASPTSIGSNGGGNLVIKLADPATGLTRTFNVIVKGTGEVSMGNS